MTSCLATGHLSHTASYDQVFNVKASPSTDLYTS